MNPNNLQTLKNVQKKYFVIAAAVAAILLALLVIIIVFNSLNKNIQNQAQLPSPIFYTINNDLAVLLPDSNGFSGSQPDNNTVELDQNGIQLIVYKRTGSDVYYNPKQQPNVFSLVHITNFDFPVLRVTSTGDIESKINSMLKYQNKYYYTNTNGLFSCSEEFGCINPKVTFKNGIELSFYCSSNTPDGADECDKVVETIQVGSFVSYP